MEREKRGETVRKVEFIKDTEDSAKTIALKKQNQELIDRIADEYYEFDVDEFLNLMLYLYYTDNDFIHIIFQKQLWREEKKKLIAKGITPHDGVTPYD